MVDMKPKGLIPAFFGVAFACYCGLFLLLYGAETLRRNEALYILFIIILACTNFIAIKKQETTPSCVLRLLASLNLLSLAAFFFFFSELPAPIDYLLYFYVTIPAYLIGSVFIPRLS